MSTMEKVFPLALLMTVLGGSLPAAEKAQIRRFSGDAASAARNARLDYGKRDAIYLSGFEAILPQLIIGGEWTATIRLTNLGTEPIPPSPGFFTDHTGAPMVATFQTTSGEVVTDSAFEFSIGPGGLIEATFFGGEETLFGHAFISPVECFDRDCDLYGEVTLKNSHPTRPDFESVFPLEDGAGVQVLLFDNRSGFSTVLYFVNPTNSALDISVDVLNADGERVRLLERSEFPLLGSEIASLHALAPETIGIQGSLVIRASDGGGTPPPFVATALRINPTNSFTPLRTVTPRGP